MKRHRIRAFFMPIMSSVLVFALGVPNTVSASEETPLAGPDDGTPTVIYSTIEDGNVDIEFDVGESISADTPKKWLCNEEEVVIDKERYADSSEGTTARLSVLKATTADHMDNYTCIIPGIEKANEQLARLYVISKENYLSAELATKEMTLPEGSILRAKDVTLYIDSTPYPNFSPLRFMDGGIVKEEVTIQKGDNSLNLTDVVLGRSVTLSVNGVGDEIAPTITKFSIKDKKADKYATEKVLEVEAEDDRELDKKPYYFEGTMAVSEAIKENVMAGKKASQIKGLSWSDKNTYKVKNNGTYTVFVRDSAGNIAYKDIVVTKISNASPMIERLDLGRDDKGAFIDVSVSASMDGERQPLEYRLNEGKWQDKSKLYKVKEGVNTVEVRNEAGKTATAAKKVYLSVFLDKEEGFSGKSLYNYIKISPETWTKGPVQVSLCLPDDLTSKLSSSPYSCNGKSFTSNSTVTVTENNETVQFTVKDIYGNTHTSESYTVTNIDKDKPSAEVTTQEGTFTVKAQDTASGVEKITVSSASANGYIIWSCDAAECQSCEARYTAPYNGSYTFTVYDYAGNTATVSGVIAFYSNEDDSLQSKVSEKKGTMQARPGSTTVKNYGSSALGTKASLPAGSTDEYEGVSTDEDPYNNGGGVVISQAGNTKSPELEDAEKIEVYRNSEKSLSGSPEMLGVTRLDNTRSMELKKLAIILSIVALAALFIVVAVNTGMFKKRRDDWDR